MLFLSYLINLTSFRSLSFSILLLPFIIYLIFEELKFSKKEISYYKSISFFKILLLNYSKFNNVKDLLIKGSSSFFQIEDEEFYLDEIKEYFSFYLIDLFVLRIDLIPYDSIKEYIEIIINNDDFLKRKKEKKELILEYFFVSIFVYLSSLLIDFSSYSYIILICLSIDLFSCISFNLDLFSSHLYMIISLDYYILKRFLNISDSKNIIFNSYPKFEKMKKNIIKPRLYKMIENEEYPLKNEIELNHFNESSIMNILSYFILVLIMMRCL